MGGRKKNKWNQSSSKTDANEKNRYGNNNNANLFLHPALLAQQAAVMRKVTSTNQTTPSNKNKKRPRNIDTNSNPEGSLVKKKKKSANLDSNNINQKGSKKDCGEKKDGHGNCIDSSKTVYMFGHPKWRRSEQLIRAILYPTIVSNHQAEENGNYNRRRMKFVFLQAEAKENFHLVRQYASMLKPILHPSGTSFACHGKVKRHQIESMLRQIITKEKLSSGINENHDGNKNCNSSAMLGSVFLVSDSSIIFLLSIMRKLIKSKGNVHNKNDKISNNREMVINKSYNEKVPLSIHYHTPVDDDIFQLRCQVVEEFQLLTMAFSSGKNKNKLTPAFPKSNDIIYHVALDGNQSEDYDKRNKNDIMLKSLASAQKNWTDIVMDDGVNFNIQNLFIPPKERSKCQAIVNSAFKLTQNSSSDGDAAARTKLMAHLSSVSTTTTTNNENDNDLPKKSQEPKYSTTETIQRMKILGMIIGDNDESFKMKSNHKIMGIGFDFDQTNMKNHRNSLKSLNKKQSKSANKKNNRESAWTCWLDRKEGKDFGGDWEGTVRQGASGEEASRNLAKLLEKCKFSSNPKKTQENKQENSDGTMTKDYCGSSPDTDNNDISPWLALKNWNPNPINEGQNKMLQCMIVDDTDRGGGDCNNSSGEDGIHDFGNHRCGKACGHNETTMFYLRPFQPLEVLNSRVCSKQSPAPGNVGFEGCLEFLCRLCASNRRGMTFWDTECFAFIDGSNSGHFLSHKKKKKNSRRKGDNQNNSQLLAPVLKLFKKDLLTSSLTTDQLSWIMVVLRQWTLFREHASTTSHSTSGYIRSGCHPKKLLNGIAFALSFALKGTIEEDEIVLNQSKNDIEANRNMDFLHMLPHPIKTKVMEFVLPGNDKFWKFIGPIHF